MSACPVGSTKVVHDQSSSRSYIPASLCQQPVKGPRKPREIEGRGGTARSFQ
jgi:hypothetical protein